MVTFLNLRSLIDAIKTRPLAKLGGDAYFIGDVFLSLFGGGVGQHWNQAVSGIGSLLGAFALSRKGDDPRWFAFLVGIGGPLVALAGLDGLLAGSIASWVGTIVYFIGAALGALSVPLTRRFCADENKWIRLTLGQPRKTMGVLIVAGKLPLLASAAASSDWVLAAVLVDWIIGDICIGLSPVEPNVAPALSDSDLLFPSPAGQG